MNSTSIGNNLRLKITDKCNFKCDFCHKEGGTMSDYILFNEKLKNILLKLQKEIGLKKIHITGGEPSLNKGVVEIVNQLSNLGFVVKMTSNGSLSKQKIDDLFASGLSSLNISINSLNVKDFLNYQNSNNYNWGVNMIKKQMENLEYMKKKGYDFKINSVVSSLEQLENIYNFAKEKQYFLRILQNLNDDYETILQHTKFFLQKIGATLNYTKKIKGSSDIVYHYGDNNNFSFAIKGIIDYTNPIVCDGCITKCSEKFYGIRLEKIGNDFYFRLCLHKTNSNTFINANDFFESKFYKSLLY